MAKVIGIISIKGGVGKTSAVSALGASLAQDYGKKVLLIDANFSAPNLGLHMGMVNPEHTLHHVLTNKIPIHKAIHESEQGFHIIPGSLVFSEVNPFKLNSKLRALKGKYDYILLDSSPSINSEILSTMIASDELYVVTTPDHVTLSTTLRAIKLAKDKKIPIAGIILNKVYGRDYELSLDEIEKATGVPVFAVIPHDEKVLEALSENKPMTSFKSESSKEIQKLASAFAGTEYKKSLPEKILSLFKKTPKQEINRRVYFDTEKINCGLKSAEVA